jgi:hypothetical protein
MTQEAAEVEAMLLRVQLAEADGRVVDKSLDFFPLYGFLVLFSLTNPYLVAALEAELEMLHHCSG